MALMTRRQEREIQKKKIIRITVIVSAVVIVIAGTIITYYLAKSSQIKPQINYAIGECKFRARSAAAWQDARVGTAIKAGFEFQTGIRSEMDLLMQDGTALRITSNSFLKLNEASAGAMDFNLQRGSLYAKMKKLIRSQDIRIRTSSCVAAIRGTELGIEIIDGTVTGYCLKGKVDMTSPGVKGPPVAITGHMKSQVAAGSAPQSASKMAAAEIDFMQKLIDSIKTDRFLYMTSKINFGSGSAEISESSAAELLKVSEILESEDGTIQIAGHTDNQGDAASNKKLSLQRAESIRKYLLKKDFPPKRLTVVGFGDTKPLYSNANEEGRAKNRRVEFVIVKD